MNKKIITILIIILALLLGFIIYNQIKIDSPKETSHQMRGVVTAVTENSITIQGVAKSDNSSFVVGRTIQFSITPDTTFKSRASVITEEQIKTEQPFKPVMADGPGMFSELKADTIILNIESDKDLFTVTAASAKNIYYLGLVHTPQ
jgi:hypothetical protein